MKPSKKTWLWKISRDDLSGTNFLFGTVHIKTEEVFCWLPLALEAMESCETVATEYDLSEGLGRRSLDFLQTPEGYRLSDHIKPKPYSRLNRLMIQFTRMPLNQFDSVHPFIPLTLLTQAVIPRDRPRAMDEEIWLRALEKGKVITGLETLESQMQLIQKLDISFHIRQLKAMSRNLGNFRSKQSKLIDLYVKAELEMVHKMAVGQLGKLRKAMVYDRNVKMTERFLEIASNTRLFAAVGGGHLYGGKGMIRLLKKEGCKVKAIKTTA